MSQNLTFSDHGHVAYQIKGIHICNNTVVNILLLDPPPDPGAGSIGQFSTFSEHGHVAYQIKGDHKCSNTDPPPTLKEGSKFNFFRIWSCCISNKRLSQMQLHCSKYFVGRPHPTPPTPTLGEGSKFIFQNTVTLHIKLKGMTRAATW